MTPGNQDAIKPVPKQENAQEQLVKEAKEFNDNLKKVSDIVTTDSENAEKINILLDGKFKAGLDVLYKTEAGKKDIDALLMTTKEKLAKLTDKSTPEYKGLDSLLKVLTAITTPKTTTKFDKEFKATITTD